jgi:hypothetical protein
VAWLLRRLQAQLLLPPQAAELLRAALLLIAPGAGAHPPTTHPPTPPTPWPAPCSYFGEQLWWWGLALWAVRLGQAWMLVGALFNSICMVGAWLLLLWWPVQAPAVAQGCCQGPSAAAPDSLPGDAPGRRASPPAPGGPHQLPPPAG